MAAQSDQQPGFAAGIASAGAQAVQRGLLFGRGLVGKAGHELHKRPRLLAGRPGAGCVGPGRLTDALVFALNARRGS